MGAAITKVCASMAATLLANFSPKLHSEIITTVENSLSAPASLDAEVTFKAFSENYIDASKSSQGNVFVGGSVGMLMLAIVLTGNLRIFLAFIVFLGGIIAGSISMAIQMFAYMEKRAEAMIPKVDAQELVLTSDQETADKFLEKFLCVKKPLDRKRFAENADCVGIIMLMRSFIDTQLANYKASYFMGSGCNKPVRSSGKDLPHELQGKTVKDLAERLARKFGNVRREFGQSYFLLQRVFDTKLTSLEEKIRLRQTSGKTEALDREILERSLRLGDIKESVSLMTSDHSALVEEAQILLENMSDSNPVSGRAMAILSEMMEQKKLLQPTMSDWAVSFNILCFSPTSFLWGSFSV